MRYSGHHKGTEEERDQGILGKDIWRKKREQQDAGEAGGRWRRQHKTELSQLDGDKCSLEHMFDMLALYKFDYYYYYYYY